MLHLKITYFFNGILINFPMTGPSYTGFHLGPNHMKKKGHLTFKIKQCSRRVGTQSTESVADSCIPY